MKTLVLVALLLAPAWARPSSDLLLQLPLNGTGKDASPAHRKTVEQGIAPAPDRHGDKNGAVRFQEGSFIQVLDYKAFNNLDQFTLSAWICPTTMREHNNIISKVTPNRDFNLQLSAVGNVVSHIMNGEYEFCYSKKTVKPNRWTFVAATYRRAATNGEWRVYIDGVVSNSVKVKHAPPWSGEFLTVGNLYPNGPEAFLGALDDVRVYQRALSDKEIAALSKGP